MQWEWCNGLNGVWVILSCLPCIWDSGVMLHLELLCWCRTHMTKANGPCIIMMLKLFQPYMVKYRRELKINQLSHMMGQTPVDFFAPACTWDCSCACHSSLEFIVRMKSFCMIPSTLFSLRPCNFPSYMQSYEKKPITRTQNSGSAFLPQ